MKFSILFCYVLFDRFNFNWSRETQNMITEDENEIQDLSYSFSNRIEFIDIIAHILSCGQVLLNNLFDQVKDQRKITTNQTILQKNLNRYFYSVNKSSNYVSQQNISDKIEEEFNVLYFVENANKILINQCNSLLQEIVPTQTKNVDNPLNYHVQSLRNYVQEAALHIKRDNYAYVCEKTNICRRYPAYSDYVAGIFNEISSLPDTKLQSALILLNGIVEIKAKFFKNIMNDEVIQSISQLFSCINENLPNTRKNIIKLKTVLQNKYYIFGSKNKKINMRKRAMRILVDIFDKSFEKLEEGAIRTEVNDVITDLRSWTYGNDVDLQKTFMDYISNVENVLTPVVSDKNLRYEVLTLIEIFVLGSTNYIIDHDLMTRGSEFVRTGQQNSPTQKMFTHIVLNKKFG